MFTVSTSCKCGAGIAIPFFALPLLYSFTDLHKHCITAISNDDNEEPGGDVYAHITLSPDHSEPELQTGFQRRWL